jgi:hypothetical protein
MATAEQGELDFDRLEADARAKLTAAEGVESALALDALSDENAQAELRAAQSERRAAEDTLRQVEQARAEQARREAVARQQAEQQRRDEAFARARELQRDREAAARKFDRAAAGLAQALAELHRLGGEQEALLAASGRRAAGVEYVTPVPVIEGALAFAYREANIAPAKAPVPARAFSARECQRLTNADPRLIEPATK